MIRPLGLVAAVAGAALLVAFGPSPAISERTAMSTAELARDLMQKRSVAVSKPLAGVRIALDPGHQLGNHRFGAKIRKPVPAGGFTKPCNTTGTATNRGYPEATFNFAIAIAVRKRLEALGAKVFLTRTSNSQKLWGPCVDARGAFGARVDAALEVSLHADGSTKAGARGFHVIAPVSRKPWTDDIAADSFRLAKALRAGLDARHLRRSNYLAGGTALMTRSDLGTLNLADVPIAMVELGNMRNAKDARLMTTAKGRARYAAAITQGIRSYLKR